MLATLTELIKVVLTPENFWGAFYYATLGGLILGAVGTLLSKDK